MLELRLLGRLKSGKAAAVGGGGRLSGCVGWGVGCVALLHTRFWVIGDGVHTLRRLRLLLI